MISVNDYIRGVFVGGNTISDSQWRRIEEIDGSWVKIQNQNSESEKWVNLNHVMFLEVT